ncbi:nucleotidyltransferase family protein [Leptospira sp. GIMC2001]|uniref:nucleotidyltransferase family protein n=1 Tax=Leptospira sp. GIMC2001 TaxID=1513297 RepID=UPI00234B4B53|nr:nucleotidyltransferase domain-containing protein [Leptospira sp. GIMC2001]WCL51188.1 nucleotidyltransferase domain-containing protein [Leptospira sp. GIMC2001]
MNIQLDFKDFEILNTIFNRYNVSDSVSIYGSRAKGSAKKYSDLDVLLDFSNHDIDNKSNQAIFYELDEDLINSDLAFRVDLKNQSKLNQEFLGRISESLISWKRIQNEFRS